MANGDSSLGVLDANALRSLIELIGDDREALAEIVEAFLEEVPQRLTELRAGIASADAVVVGRVAHTLKANGRTFGAERLARLSEEIEIAARGGDLGPASARIEDLDEAWQEVLPEVAALVAGDGA